MYALYYNAREIDRPVAEFFHPIDFFGDPRLALHSDLSDLCRKGLKDEPTRLCMDY